APDGGVRFFFSSRRRHTRFSRDWSSDVCSSDLASQYEARLERELRFAQRVQAALLPTQLPKRIKGVDLSVAFAPARELGGDFHEDRKSTRLNSSHVKISYAVFCLKKINAIVIHF